MAFGRYGTFTGGIDLPDDKQATLDTPIQPCSTPSRLVVPLALSGVSPARPLVQAGERVQAGQTIAQGASNGADVFAPLGGRVRAATTAQVATLDGFVASPAIELTEIEGPWGDANSAAPKTNFNWQQADEDVLRQRLVDGSLPTHRRNCEPLAAWMDRALANRCRVLIANAMENQPYVSADHRVLVEQGREVLQGLAMLARAIGARDVLLAADQRRISGYRPLLAAVRHYRINAIALPHKYPIGCDPLLVKVLTRKEMPPGGSTMQAGSAVIDPATCLAIYRWIVLGQRTLGRVVTVGGPNAQTKGNFFVPFGMPCQDLSGGVAGLIHGGPMVGLRCPTPSGPAAPGWDFGAIVTPATDAVLALDVPPPRQSTPCIRCGWCTDHCPARLNVSALNDAFELGSISRAARLGVMACMECGVCSYICPSCLPLTQRVKRLKRMLFCAWPRAASRKQEVNT